MDKASLRKLIVGPMGVLPTPFDENYQLDLGRMNAMIQRLIDSGVTHGKGVLKIASAVGEGPMLSDTEIPAVLIAIEFFKAKFSFELNKSRYTLFGE